MNNAALGKSGAALMSFSMAKAASRFRQTDYFVCLPSAP